VFGAAIGFWSGSDVPPTLPVRADEVIALCGGSWQRSRTPRNHGGPGGIVDHFAIGIPAFNRAAVEGHLKQRGATPLQGDYAGLHVKDPDGNNVQIIRSGSEGPG